jgi:hypothetical protein
VRLCETFLIWCWFGVGTHICEAALQYLQEGTHCFVCTWAQEERPADLHMAQPNVPVRKTGHFPTARLVRDVRADGSHAAPVRRACAMYFL